MKTNRILNKNSTRKTPSPEQIRAKKGRFQAALQLSGNRPEEMGNLVRPGWRVSVTVIAELLHLSPKQAKAFGLILEWEGETAYEYCKLAVLARLNISYADMESLGKDDTNPREKEWASKFLPIVKPLFPKNSRF